ncbi:MAG: hypothetical protein KF696_10165 [Planctomycetes bacterium]|nr:hypothetical protein [Planctomycetota bacterium]MCW8135207.1 hypothetical protein [Planctomycetota bacterium]
MAETVAKEIRTAAEQAEAKAKAAAAEKQFEKAADYFTFAATTWRRIAEGLEGEKQRNVQGRAEKLELMAKQCRSVAARGQKGAMTAPPAPVQPAEDKPSEESALTLEENTEAAAGESDEIDVPEDEPASIPAPPAIDDKPQVRLPGKKRRKGPRLPGKGPVTTAPPPAAPPSTTVAAPPPVPPVEMQLEDKAEVAYESEPDMPAKEEPEHDYGSVPVAPVLGKHNISSQRVPAVSDLNELADNKTERSHSVVISLDQGDFPEPKPDPEKFSIELSPRFTAHLCESLVVGDLGQIAAKFEKLANNLVRKAHAGDPRDELDLRFTALVCRELADRLLAGPPGDPGSELGKAREAYRKGDMQAAADHYKQAALKLLGTDSKGAPPEQLALQERQAGEYLGFSSRLRAAKPRT